MKVHAIATLSAALLVAGCSDTQKREEPPQPKPAALMAAPPPVANSVEAQPVDDVPLEANAADSVQQGSARQSLGSHTIGDRREQ